MAVLSGGWQLCEIGSVGHKHVEVDVWTAAAVATIAADTVAIVMLKLWLHWF
jgi:hypothetical protein